jgi:hypothetical protein
MGQRFAPARNQVQAAGLVGTFRSLETNGAEVSSINQPALDAGHVRAFHRAADELLQHVLHRLLVRDIQEQARGQIRIEPIITLWFHNGQILSEAGRFLNPIRTIIRTFNISTRQKLGHIMRKTVRINQL